MVLLAHQFNSPLNYLIFMQRQNLSSVKSLANPNNWPYSKEVVGRVLGQLPDSPMAQLFRQLSSAKISLVPHASLQPPADRQQDGAPRNKQKPEERWIKVFAKWPPSAHNKLSRISEMTPATAEKKEPSSEGVKRTASQPRRQAGVKISKSRAS